MEGMIARSYTRTTSRDVRRHKDMAVHVVPLLPPGASVLEVAPGPGYFCIELAKLGLYKITGLDISKSFVEIASRNAAAAGVQADFRLGNASAMPLEDRSFDFIFCQAAFKNFSEPVDAIREMYRVLRPGGKAMIVDLRRDATPQEIHNEIEQMNLGAVDKLMTTWTFKQMLLKSAYRVSDMESMISRTPFGKGRIDIGNIGFQVLLEK
jgi:ubiquinone/menaquinone biosynthesis C-methylase UbiE